ncbi:receptor-binding cancer antigen expressed on SiSo cells-like [Clytia hemisphaerica]|uniref:Cnidarian restricted protein n=1 Tax=Clytia hemisphaerica TaxID=252671 RepID=A0A7M5U4R4_9CNID
MRTMFMNFKICKFFCAIFSKLLCFIKKKKKSRDEASYSATTPLSTIQIQGSGKTTDIDLVDWNNWGEDASKNEENQEESEISAVELFKDMEPTIAKAKVVHVKQTIRKPTTPTKQKSPSSPFAFQSKFSDSRKSRYTPKYQVEAELGTMDDGDEGGWDEQLDDLDINQETENMLKQNKQLERQKRAEEQRRKKLERDQHRLNRGKNETSFGVKVT